jgi:hypothetical protein
MKVINNEYDNLTTYKDYHNTFTDDTQQQEQQTNTNNFSDENQEFRDIINDLINLDDIEISIIGSWYWIDGNTEPHKDIFKRYGFEWKRKTSRWYKKPNWYKFSKTETKNKTFSLEEHYKDKTFIIKERTKPSELNSKKYAIN